MSALTAASRVGFGLPQDGDIWVVIFPERDEIFLGGGGRHRRPLPARFSTARHSHEPHPDVLTPPSGQFQTPLWSRSF